MKIGISIAVLVVVVALTLWMNGFFGGQTVLGTSWLNGQSGGSSGAQVVIVIGEGGVPEGLAPGSEVIIGPLDTGAPYCKAEIVAEIDTPDGPGYSTECIEAL
jgi:hypothetical protein